MEARRPSSYTHATPRYTTCTECFTLAHECTVERITLCVRHGAQSLRTVPYAHRTNSTSYIATTLGALAVQTGLESSCVIHVPRQPRVPANDGRLRAAQLTSPRGGKWHRAHCGRHTRLFCGAGGDNSILKSFTPQLLSTSTYDIREVFFTVPHDPR